MLNPEPGTPTRAPRRRGEVLRRPGVAVVVVLLVAGAALTTASFVQRGFTDAGVRAATAAVRGMDWPAGSGIEDWPSACGLYGLACGATHLEPRRAAEHVAAELEAEGIEVGPVACGDLAPRVQGGTLAVFSPSEHECAAVAQVSGFELTVVARDGFANQPVQPPSVALGTTAVVVEWDSAGVENLARSEAGRFQSRFDPEPLDAPELAAVPVPLDALECRARDDDGGCLAMGGEVPAAEVVGPGGVAGFEAFAAELADHGFLLTALGCVPARGGEACTVTAERGRPGEVTTMLMVYARWDSAGDPEVLEVTVSVQ